jgi:CRISPR system Cascade subunit CasA
MTDTGYSLLTDDIITIRDTDGDRHTTTLPDVFAQLVEGDIASFEALQAHQKQAWYGFLTQLGAMTVARENDGDLPSSADQWREHLLALSDGEQAAWWMVVEDTSKPGFFQPPVPEGSLDEAGYSLDIETPDDLGMLVTSKNHDVKMHRIRRPNIEHWMYALLTLQTLEGFLGRGNYGIARMNGGFGNRPLVGVTPDLSWGTRFTRDVQVLIGQRPELVADRFADDGIALLWTEPWDGAKDSRIPLSACDPYFVEICRRLRFRENDDGELECWRNNTKDYRIDNVRDLNGLIDDPWTPVDVSDQKALTVSGQGFDYQLLQQIWLGGDDDTYEPPPALEFRDSEADGGHLIAASLVRGQGKTEGLHRRRIPIPNDVAGLLFGDESRREKLGRRAERRVDRTGRVQKKVLAPALISLLEAGQDRGTEYGDVTHWLDHFDSAVDDLFFDELWHSVEQEMSDREAKVAWQETLFDLAHDELERAIETCPFPDIMRYRAISEGESRFWSAAREHLGAYFDDEFDANADATSETTTEEVTP